MHAIASHRVSLKCATYILFGWLFTLVPFHAQSPGSGTITGRIFNAATGEYVRNAEVRIDGTNRVVVSEDGGYYRLSGVPAGEVIVSVNYTGYERATDVVNVAAGQTATHDVELARASSQRTADGTVQLSAFVVSSEREGNAKAIMEQRNSMSMATSVAADIFGDITQGNAAEFLKFLPGVELEYFEADAKGVRLGGLDPAYTGVAMDGMKLASADAYMQQTGLINSEAGADVRSFGFDQVSINSIESIEVHRVTPAELDADAPAGTVNLKTKRAFDRKGRQIKWSLGASFNSEEFTLGKATNVNDGPSRMLKPTYSFDYSDTFFNQRLGILIGISEANTYTENYWVRHFYNFTPTAADPRPQVLQSLQFRDAPKWQQLFTASMTADFKATPRLVLSLSAVLNNNEDERRTSVLTFTAATNNTNATTGRQHVAGDGILTFATGTAPAANRTVAAPANDLIKVTDTITITPKFEYKLENLTIDGAYAFSKAKNDYYGFARRTATGAGRDSLTNVSFIATRPDPWSAAWTVTQTSGLDWADSANYLNPRLSDDGKNVLNEVSIASLNAKYSLPMRIPAFIKVGVKLQDRKWVYDYPGTDFGSQRLYVGPGGGPTGSYADYATAPVMSVGSIGATFHSIGGGTVPTYPRVDELGNLFAEHPEYFQAYTPGPTDYTGRFRNGSNFEEEIPAAYAMGNVRLGKWQFQGGVRWEETKTLATEYDPLPPDVVRAAGYPVNNSTGHATTAEGVEYQFLTNPLAKRRGKYQNFFPSITAKYRVAENLIADFGYGKTISRPWIKNLSGLWSYNDVSETITVPNPKLKPEHSDRFAASLGYYFGAASSLTLVLTETHIENLAIRNEYTAEEWGLTDPLLSTYTVLTSESGEEKRRFRGLELSYRHQLTFLPGILQGTSVFASYTRTYANERRPGLTPHTATGGFDYRYKRLSFGIRGVWQDEAPWTRTVNVTREANIKLDGNIAFKITRRLEAFARVRNMFNESYRLRQLDALQREESFGSLWVFGVRGQF